MSSQFVQGRVRLSKSGNPGLGSKQEHGQENRYSHF